MSTIVTRTSKESPLSWVEADANLTNLNTDKLEASALTPYLTSATAASTYETQTHASSTYETQTHASSTYPTKANNLSDLTSASTARTNLGLGTAATAASSSFATSGAVTSNGNTMSTAKLIGRSTAGTGALEEITVGTGLTLSSGSLSVSSGVMNSLVRCKTHNGYGSTKNKIPRFTTIVTKQGSDITYTDSAVDGASFTVNTNGVYAINFNASCSGASMWACFTKNEASFTTAPNSVPDTEYLSISSASVFYPVVMSCTLYLQAGDVIRPHGDGNTYGVFMFTMQRVA